MAKNTIIDGIAASEHLDSSGESLSIEGMDISSLGGPDSILNWEHGSKEKPSQVVGKVTFARKIFKASDARNKREMYFWNKAKKPFVYIKAELFDGIGHSGAQDVAAMLKYKNRDKGKKSRLVVGFSIEGGKMDKKGMVVTKSIARDVAITVKPCNKVCDAEIATPSDSDDFLYKNQKYDCEILQKGEYAVNSRTYRDLIVSDIKKSLPKLKADYKSKIESFKNTKSFKQKGDKSDEIGKLASKPLGLSADAKPKREFDSKSAPSSLKVTNKIKYNNSKKTNKDISDSSGTFKSENNMRKALVAGMMNASPGTLTGGAALASEDLMGTIQDVTNKQKSKKKEKKLQKMSQPVMSNKNLNSQIDLRSDVKTIDPNKKFTNKAGKEFSQADIENKKIQNKYVQGEKEVSGAESIEDFTPEAMQEVNSYKQKYRNSVNPKASGVNVQNSDYGINEAYDMSTGQSNKEMKENKFKGNSRSTAHHEATHKFFSGIEQNYSKEHSQSLTNHLLENFFDPKDLKDINNNLEMHYGKDYQHMKEENLTYILDLLQNKETRSSFHSNSSHMNTGKIHPNKAQKMDQKRIGRLKSGWKNAVNFVNNMSSDDLNNINKQQLSRSKR
jgi:hypothetical protein